MKRYEIKYLFYKFEINNRIFLKKKKKTYICIYLFKLNKINYKIII